MLYKRIAGAENDEELEALTAEIVDRFGVLPEAAQRLIEITRLKQRARALGIERIHAGPTGARLDFGPEPAIDAHALVRLIQSNPKTYHLQGEKRLTLRRELPDFAHRIKTVTQTLTNLTPAA